MSNDQEQGFDHKAGFLADWTARDYLFSQVSKMSLATTYSLARSTDRHLCIPFNTYTVIGHAYSNELNEQNMSVN